MKEFLITAQLDPKGKSLVYGREFAHNLRDAWRLFKSNRSTLYSRLFFHFAVSEGKYYDKLC